MTPAFSLYGGPFLLRKYYTSGTQVVHRWYTSGTQVVHRSYTSTTQVLHKHYIFRSMTPDIPQKKATVMHNTVHYGGPSLFSVLMILIR